jgi:hypothetical protein
MSRLCANNLSIHSDVLTVQKFMDRDIVIPNIIFPLRRASEIIENIIIGLPLSPVWLKVNSDSTYTVVNELHTVRSIKEYMTNEFRICTSAYLPSECFVTFDELPRHIQRKIQETLLTTYIIDPKTPEATQLDIIDRLNHRATWR